MRLSLRLKRAWFGDSTLEPVMYVLVSECACKWVNVYRYVEGALFAGELRGVVGLYKLNPVDPFA
jgi:hypothetical protein